MPIVRNTSSKLSGQTKGFQDSVAGVPMAMSLMIDSMVNMVQNNRSSAPSANSKQQG